MHVAFLLCCYILLGADIDTLLITPRHIERSDFFSSFQEMLLSEKGVSNVRAVPDAFVPVLKIEYEGIEVRRVMQQKLPPAPLGAVSA